MTAPLHRFPCLCVIRDRFDPCSHFSNKRAVELEIERGRQINRVNHAVKNNSEKPWPHERTPGNRS